MANTKEKLQTLKTLHSQQQALYAEKNEKYDDAFAKTYAEYGPTVAIIRLEDKLNRVKALVAAGLDDSNGESLVDTLTDMANYANMTIMELIGESGTLEGSSNKKGRKPRKSHKETTGEEGPLDHFSKKQLISIIEELGGSVPKKANREKLISTIGGYPKAKVAVVITSLSSADQEENNDGEEE